MKIIDLLEPNAVIPNMAATTKLAVLEELAAPLVPGPEGLDLDTVVEVLMERERLGSTGIGDHVAIPHGKLANLKGLRLSFGRSLQGVNFDSMDGKPSHLFFLLLAPVNSAGLHLKALAKISRMLMNAAFREKLMQAADKYEIYQLLKEQDEEM
jgi:PTS system nitrogen regulatory IIA component|uniref:PTS sugar transporter subunit IIA n=1 Tax=Desulfobacca acetoxidans TaxID=60893 RepID=A0A7C3V0N0_9BACT